MKGYIHYIKGHKDSEKQASESLKSFLQNDWDVSLREGITPDTLDDKEFDYPLIKGGRLSIMKENGEEKYFTKKSCISNQIRLWRECVRMNTPLAFIEHDAICLSSFDRPFDEVICFNLEYAFLPPTVLSNYSILRDYSIPSNISPKPFPADYPLTYPKKNSYEGSKLIPGTAAYGVTPKGARKLLIAAEKYGLEQSDYFINTSNVNIEYVTPSPVKFNITNLNTSHGWNEK